MYAGKCVGLRLGVSPGSGSVRAREGRGPGSCDTGQVSGEVFCGRCRISAVRYACGMRVRCVTKESGSKASKSQK